MEQLTATVKQNADNAEQAHKLARDVSDTADRGSEMVCYVIEKCRISPAARSVLRIILSVIDGIAFRPIFWRLTPRWKRPVRVNRGADLPVVAGEVRNLASRSADAGERDSPTDCRLANPRQ